MRAPPKSRKSTRSLSGPQYSDPGDAASALAPSPEWPLQKLSQRECEVLRLIGLSKSIRETAAALQLSPKTIETYRDRIKRKLCLRTGVELRNLAILACVVGETVLTNKFFHANSGTAPKQELEPCRK